MQNPCAVTRSGRSSRLVSAMSAAKLSTVKPSGMGFGRQKSGTLQIVALLVSGETIATEASA